MTTNVTSEEKQQLINLCTEMQQILNKYPQFKPDTTYHITEAFRAKIKCNILYNCIKNLPEEEDT